MELKVMSFDGKSSGSVQLSDTIFGLEPRPDILQRCVTWQLAKRRAGTHKVKNRAEINRTGKKMYRQKGTGSARHGPAKGQPVPRRRPFVRSGGAQSRGSDLPKKVRALALSHALSAKAKDSRISVVKNKATIEGGKTKVLAANFEKLGLKNVLVIDGTAVDVGFARAAHNIPNVDVLPVQGINVYDILRRVQLVLTKAALEALEARFK